MKTCFRALVLVTSLLMPQVVQAKTAAIQVPAVPEEIQVDPAFAPFLTGHAIGTQGYVCVAVGAAFSWAPFALVIALVPLGAALNFPSVTALLSRVVGEHERGLYMGVQQTWGGITRVAFPVAGGALMDAAGVGTPFALAGVLLLLALPLTVGIAPAESREAAHLPP